MLQPIDWINILQKEKDIEFSRIKWEIPMVELIMLPLLIGAIYVIIEIRMEETFFPVLCPGVWIVIIIALLAIYVLVPPYIYLRARNNMIKYNDLIQLILRDENITSPKIYEKYRNKFPLTKQIPNQPTTHR